MFGLLSANEREYIGGGIDQNMRADGRSNLTARSISVETNIVTQASGSARITLATTDVLVGIKAEIAETKLTKPNEGYFVCAVECSASASQEFEGRGAEDLNNELSQMLERILSQKSILDLTALCIIPGSQCWAIYIDTLVLDFGGNLFDAIMVGVRAALATTKIPKVTVLDDGEGGKEIEVSDDPEDVTTIDVSNVPLTTTLHKIGKRFIVDASLQEELCSEARVVVAVTKSEKVVMAQKAGGGSIHPSTLIEMIQTGKKLGAARVAKLDETLKREEELGNPKQGFFL